MELAGALSELIQHVLNKDYPMLDLKETRVILVEANERILVTFPESLQRSAMKKLESMGVQIRLLSPVESVDDGRVTFKDGSQLQAGTIVWAAGVRSADQYAPVTRLGKPRTAANIVAIQQENDLLCRPPRARYDEAGLDNQWYGGLVKDSYCVKRS